MGIRFFRSQDSSDLFSLMSDPLVVEKLPDMDKIGSLAEASRTIEEMIADTCDRRRFCQALVRQEDDVLMGTMVANKRNLSEQSAYISYELHPAYWGKGVMFEGLQKFIPMVQKEFSLKKIQAQTTVDNGRSQGLLKKLGFLKAQEFDYAHPVNGRFVKAFLYMLDLC